MSTDLRAWAVEWHSVNRLDGDRHHLIWDSLPNDPGDFRLFRTRRDCRAFIEEKYGYIRERPDLQREPHGWHMPRAVRVAVIRERIKATGGDWPLRERVMG